MKKNTEILPDFVLKDLREQKECKNSSREVKSSNDKINNEINHMSPDEIVKNWTEWNGIINYHKQLMELIEGAFQVKLVREDSKKKWCCWELDMEEILHAMQDAKVSDNYSPLMLWTNASEDDRETFVEEITSEFKNALSIMGEEWEEALKGCVENVVKTWKERKGLQF